MELDTGAHISHQWSHTQWTLAKRESTCYKESKVKLKTYSGEQLSVKGVIKVEVQHKDQCKQLLLLVAWENGPSLLGSDWLMKLCLDWTQLCANHVCYSLSLQDILDEHASIFSSELGMLKERLPFRVSAAPAIFQKTMETILQGLPGVCVYLDDLLITGKSKEEHLVNLSAVLSRLATAGMKLKWDKCSFLLQEVEYLGHNISTKGLKLTTGKVQAIVQAPQPTNVTQLKLFWECSILWKISTQFVNMFSPIVQTTPEIGNGATGRRKRST